MELLILVISGFILFKIIKEIKYRIFCSYCKFKNKLDLIKQEKHLKTLKYDCPICENDNSIIIKKMRIESNATPPYTYIKICSNCGVVEVDTMDYKIHKSQPLPYINCSWRVPTEQEQRNISFL